MSAYRSSRTLPLGVAILAFLIGIVGVLYLIFGILLIFAVAILGSTVPHVFGVGLVGGIVLLIFGALLLFVASGLWGLELWALVLCLLVVGVLWLSDLLGGDAFSLGGIVLLVLLIYLVAVHREFT